MPRFMTLFIILKEFHGDTNIWDALFLQGLQKLMGEVSFRVVLIYDFDWNLLFPACFDKKRQGVMGTWYFVGDMPGGRDEYDTHAPW